MKKLRITVNGKEYEVDVEILEDSDNGAASMPPYPMYPPMGGGYQPTAHAPAPVAAPRPRAKAPSASQSGNELTSPMNGVVLEIPVSAGSTVKEGQVVVILEAMKMKTNVASPRDGVIAEIKVRPNDSVESGQVLLTYSE